MTRVSELLADPQMRRLGSWALRAIGPVLLAVLLVRFVDYGELRDVLAGMDLSWGLAAVAIMQLFLILRAFRWIEIHRAFGLPDAPLSYHLRLSYATNLAATVLPQILNTFYRPVLMVQDGYRARRALAGSILEKLGEFAAFIAFGLYGSLFLAHTFAGLVWWAAGLTVLAVAATAFAWLFRSRLTRLAVDVIERIPGLDGGAEEERAEAAHEIVSLNARVLLRIFAWSLVIALTQATMLYFLARSLDVGLSYPFMVAAWGMVALSMLLPISVNGIGTREAVLVAAFHAADKSTDAAVALGLLVLAIGVVGSAPGAIEWLRRAIGNTRPVARPIPAPGPPAATGPGEHDR
jgi:uncharacterized membrane protein YbhN (UPF0104 family)